MLSLLALRLRRDGELLSSGGFSLKGKGTGAEEGSAACCEGMVI